MKIFYLVAFWMLITVTSFSQVNPVRLGSSSDFLRIPGANHNIISVDPESNTVFFLHYQNVNVYGGGSPEKYRLRYDQSIDGGVSFTDDIGQLFPDETSFDFSNPQFVLLDQENSNSVDDLKLILSTAKKNEIQIGPTTFNSYTLKSGVSDPQNPPNFSGTTSNNIGTTTLLPLIGSLTYSGKSNVWMPVYNTSLVQNNTEGLRILRGILNPTNNNIEWSLAFAFDYDINANPRSQSINLDFSDQDSLTGWLSLVGNLQGGEDDSYLPIISKTTDGGSTWSPIEEIILLGNKVTYHGAAATLAEEFSLAPQGEYIHCSHESDLIVDANGNPHILLILSKTLNQLEYNPGEVMIIADLTTNDGGLSWDLHMIDRVLTYETVLSSNTFTDDISLFNYPQISIDQTGGTVFYSWVDSQSSILASNYANLAPDLHIASLEK